MAAEKADSAQIKQMISDSRARRIARQAPASEQIEIRKLRQNLAKQLKPIFERAGLDVKEIEDVYKRYQEELQQLVEQQHNSRIKTNLGARAETFDAALANRARGLNRIANKPLTTFSVQLDEAWFIEAYEGSLLAGYGIGWQNNWLCTEFETDKTTVNYFDFYFFWQNDSGYPAVVNASAELSAFGLMKAHANAPFGYADVILSGLLHVFVGDVDGMPYQGPIILGGTNAFAGLFGGQSEHRYFDGQLTPLASRNVTVDPGQAVVPMVSAIITSDVSDGAVSWDFNSGDYSIMCPGVVLEVSTQAIIQ
jgi:hypothetical protein